MHRGLAVTPGVPPPELNAVVNLVQTLALFAAGSTGRLLPAAAAPRVSTARHPMTWLAICQAPWVFMSLVDPALYVRSPWLRVVDAAGAVLYRFMLAELCARLAALGDDRHPVPRRGWLYGGAAVMSAIDLAIGLPIAPALRDTGYLVDLAFSALLWGLALRALVMAPPSMRPSWEDRATFGIGIVLRVVGFLSLGIARAEGGVALLVSVSDLAIALPFVPRRLHGMVRGAVVVIAAVAIAWVGALGAAALVTLGPGSDPWGTRLGNAVWLAVLALVWGGCAEATWRTGQHTDEPGTPWTLLLLATSGQAIGLWLDVVIWTLPPELFYEPKLVPLFLVRGWFGLAPIAMGCHLVRLLTRVETPPSRRWLTVNYGVPASVFIVGELGAGVAAVDQMRIMQLSLAAGFIYAVVAVVFILRGILMMRRESGWRDVQAVARGGGVGLVDLSLFGLAALTLLAAGYVANHSGPRDFGRPPLTTILLGVVLGTTVVMPVALRALGQIVRTLIGAGTAIGLGLVATVVLRAVVPPLQANALPRLATAVCVAVLAGLLIPLHRWLRRWLEDLVIRNVRSRRDVLAGALARVSPETGVDTCCGVAVREAATVFRTAGIRLLGGECFATEALDLGPVSQAWTSEAASITTRAQALVGTYELRILAPEVQRALASAGITAVVSIRSPDRDWGQFFVGMHLLDSAFLDEGRATMLGFASQLALLLDAAALVARVRDAERTLAHAEKLAAVGEAAARIAHDVRNPITAARSMAQQLADEPDDPYRDEHRLVVAELSRVERHVASLLRFSRRDEPAHAPVDLAHVVHRALAPLVGSLADGGVALTVDVPEGIVVRGDADALRDAIGNLMDNARDALKTTSAPCLAVTVERPNGLVRLHVRDNGPGVSPEALPRLFEPFFSSKPAGTGLGLAIAKRTVEAHGGAIRADRPAEGGFEVVVELPYDGAR